VSAVTKEVDIEYLIDRLDLNDYLCAVSANTTYIGFLLLDILTFRIDTSEATRLEFHQITVDTLGTLDEQYPLDTSLKLTSDNFIVGVYAFSYEQTLSFDIYPNSDTLWVQKQNYTKKVRAFLEIVYVLACHEEYQYYSSFDGTCKICLPNCFKCTNHTEC
jgi:hypothetical protein